MAPRVPGAGGAGAAAPASRATARWHKQDFEFYRILPQGDNVPSSAAQVVPVPAPQVQAPPWPCPRSRPRAGVRGLAAPAAVTPPGAPRNERICRWARSRTRPKRQPQGAAGALGHQASARSAPSLPTGASAPRARGPFAKPEDMNPMRALFRCGFQRLGEPQPVIAGHRADGTSVRRPRLTQPSVNGVPHESS